MRIPMAAIEHKVALVTGASSGIGKETVLQLLDRGARVYAAARRVEKMQPLQEAGAEILALDVTSSESIDAALETITNQSDSVDILINNAGYGSYGAIEDVPIEEARRQFEVNIFGLAALTRQVLPAMREKRYGKIVNISSMGGKVYTPFGGWYHATKHALEGLSDCLRLETTPFGIDTIIIEPGGIKTPWGTIAAENLKKTSGSGAYAQQAQDTAQRMARLYTSKRLSDPSVIAAVILKALTATRPKTRYVAGYGAGAALFLRHWIGDRLFDRIISAMV
jgi:NAD(P)-dependent dehydrogenase (short-subunit alcohol dehydrogenase family)